MAFFPQVLGLAGAERFAKLGPQGRVRFGVWSLGFSSVRPGFVSGLGFRGFGFRVSGFRILGALGLEF